MIFARFVIWRFRIVSADIDGGRRRQQQDGRGQQPFRRRRITGRQRVQQRPKRQAQVHTGYPVGGRAGGPVRRVPPARFRVRGRIQFQNASDMRLSQSDGYKVS